MKLLYGTGNPAKLADAKRWTEGLDFELLSLRDMEGEIPEVSEDGSTMLENAAKKAHAYYRAFGIPVFSCDTGLYFDNVAEEDQPGVHVRTVNGKYLTDQEMREHYIGLVRKYGRLTAQYRSAICLVLDENRSFELMDESLESERFFLTDRPHPHAINAGYPLDGLSIHIGTGRYYYDLGEDQVRRLAVGDGFRRFFEATVQPAAGFREKSCLHEFFSGSGS